MRRSFGGGTSGVAAGPDSWSSVLSSRVAVLLILTASPSARLLHEHLRFPDRDLRPTGSGRSAGWFRSVLRPAHVMTQSEVAVTVYLSPGFVRAGRAVDVAAVGRLLVAVRRLVRRAGRRAGDLGAVTHVPGDLVDPSGGGDRDAARADAEAVVGPTVWLSGLAAHIHTGMPTMPMLSVPGLGRDADVDRRRFIWSIASCATSRGVGPGAGVRRRVGGPDPDEQVGLRLVAAVDRAVARLVPLPARVARRRLRVEQLRCSSCSRSTSSRTRSNSRHRPGRRLA